MMNTKTLVILASVFAVSMMVCCVSASAADADVIENSVGLSDEYDYGGYYGDDYDDSYDPDCLEIGDNFYVGDGLVTMVLCFVVSIICIVLMVVACLKPKWSK